jgi:hypothetical protein
MAHQATKSVTAAGALGRRAGTAARARSPRSMVARGAIPFIKATEEGAAVAATDGLTPTDVRERKWAGKPTKRPTKKWRDS